MPGMTMPFKVEDPRLLDGLTAGDLVKATLVVKDSNGYLSSVERTGHEAADGRRGAAARGPPGTGQHVPDVRLDRRNRRAPHAVRLARPRRSPSRSHTRAVHCRTSVRGWIGSSSRPGCDPGGSATARPRRAAVGQLRSGVRHAARCSPRTRNRVGADPASWQFATGERNEIDAFASRFGVSVIREGAERRRSDAQSAHRGDRLGRHAGRRC